MSIHFASSHAADFFKLAGTVNPTPHALFDPAYVKASLFANAGAPNWRQIIPPLVNTDFYWQAKWVAGSVAGGGPRNFINFINRTLGVQTVRIQIYPTGGGLALRYWNGSAFVTVGSAIAIGANVLYTITVQIKSHAVNGIIAFWLNNAPIASFSGDTTGIFANIQEVEIWNETGSTGAGGNYELAEFLVTKDEHPYLMKVKTHVLQANSAVNTGWTGDYTYVDEVDPSSADIISAAAANLTSTFTVDPLPALGSLIVRAVQVSAVARRGTSGPTKARTVLRASGLNQESTDLTLQTGFNTIYNVYEQNSVTGLEFTKAEIDASEPGIRSVA